MANDFSNKKNGTWESSIVQTLEELKGTFGLWIYIDDPTSKTNTFICRNGSTLYGDLKTGSFSSSSRDGFSLLSEEQLYSVGINGINPVAKFKSKPMYFFT